MIRKSTLVFFSGTIILGGAFSYLEIKKGLGSKLPETTKLALPVAESDVDSLTLTHPGKPDEPAIHLEKDSSNNWQIVQPVASAANQATVQGILDSLTTARASDSPEPATADRLKAYGLTPPQLELELALKNGSRHTLNIGDKDFTGSWVYAVVDGAQTVSLLPAAVLRASNNSLDALRDHTALHLTTVASFTLKNPSGELALTKADGAWKFTKPGSALADQDAINALLTAISEAKLTTFASQKADKLAEYELANPAISFTSVDAGGQKATLMLGKKDGDQYFARDASRTSVFRVGANLYTQLARSFGDLRDKMVVHSDSANVTRVEFRNDHGTIVVNNTIGDNWTIDGLEGQKGQSASSYKIFYPLNALRAEEIFDHPSAALVATLAKPAIQVTLTDKSGKKLTLKMSRPSGDVVYAQTSDSNALYKLRKESFDSLNFEASGLLE